jgi:hypothetical protein
MASAAESSVVDPARGEALKRNAGQRALQTTCSLRMFFESGAEFGVNSFMPKTHA